MKLTVTPTAPATGTDGSAPISLYYSDSAGFNLARLTVNWTWSPPVTDAGAD